MEKKFINHFFLLHTKLKYGENFAFSRFSDGELRIMQNKELILAENFCKIGEQVTGLQYFEEDRKHFDPKEHQFYRDKLFEAYRHKQKNYYVGLCCSCCVGDEDFKLMLDWYSGDTNSEYLTWANLWINGNYNRFKTYVVPELANKKVVYVVNEHADLKGLPFKVEKDFRVGVNCIINDYGLIEVMDKWITDNNITNHVFLFSASSLSNFLIYELFKKHPNNTYIDVGTCFNVELKMKGVRGYLSGNNTKICVW